MLPLSRARATWLAHQGLTRPVSGSLAELVAATGWLRTLGGVEAYLAVDARRPGTPPDAVDAALAAAELQVLPAVRGCVYVLPRAHAALGLRFAASQARRRTWRDLEKAGVGPAEVAELQAAVRAALAVAPLGTDELRQALPKGTVRSLGEAGKKVGLSSPLPACLRLLEFDGALVRRPAARLDAERYRWHHAASDPFAGAPAEDDAAALVEGLLRAFFAQSGLTTLDAFVEWSGAGKKECKAAAERLGARPVEVDGLGPALLAPGVEPAEEPDPDHVVFLPALDNYVVTRDGGRVLADPEHHARPVGTFGMRVQPLGAARIPDGRFVVRGGRIVGVWDWDPDHARVAWGTWSPVDRHPAMEAEAERVGAVLRALGHGLWFSLDTVDAQRARVRALP